MCPWSLKMVLNTGILWHTLAYSGILLHTLAYSGILGYTLACSGILWHNQCIVNNCWRSVPLPCGQYMVIFYIDIFCKNWFGKCFHFWEHRYDSWQKMRVTHLFWTVSIRQKYQWKSGALMSTKCGAGQKSENWDSCSRERLIFDFPGDPTITGNFQVIIRGSKTQSCSQGEDLKPWSVKFSNLNS